MKNNFIYLSFMLLVGISTIKASQSGQSFGKSRLPEAYANLRTDIITAAGAREDTKTVNLFETNNDILATILSPTEGYKAKEKAYISLMGGRIESGITIFNNAIRGAENKAILDFLYSCNALDALGKSGRSTVMKDFFDKFTKEESVPESTRQSILRLLDKAITRMEEEDRTAEENRAAEENRTTQEQIESVDENAELTDEELLRINEELKKPGINIDLDKVKHRWLKSHRFHS